MPDEITIQPSADVSVVNRRVPLPDAAREELRRAYGVAVEARRVADLLLRQTMLALDVDPEKAMFDTETGDIVLDGELDKERLKEEVARFLEGGKDDAGPPS